MCLKRICHGGSRKNVPAGIDLVLSATAVKNSSVIMPETDLGFAQTVAERLRQRIAETEFPVDEGGRVCSVTVSIGIAALEGPKDTVSDLLARADEALYIAKRDGRNRVVSNAA